MDQLEQVISSNFKQFETQLNGNAGPLHKIRKEAISTFESLGLPDARNEEYKYTPIAKALRKNFSFEQTEVEHDITLEDIKSHFIPGLEAHNLIFVNGQFHPEMSSFTSGDELIIKSLPEALTENEEDILKHFGKLADSQTDAFIALNTSFIHNGVFVHIKRNQTVNKPVAIYHINDARKGQVVVQPRNLFWGEENSECTLLEIQINLGAEETFNNTVTEIVVDKSARIAHYKIQNNEPTAYHVGSTQVKQADSSLFSSYTFTLNGGIIRNNLNVKVQGRHCETHMYGLYVVNGNTHVDNHTAVDHIEPDCFSNELYKGILEDKAHGVFNGKVYVRSEAQKTNAFQSNKNILLSNDATVNTKPQLEIWADDVKCSHGCTTGQLDKDALFYLQARGLSRESARSLLLYAFAVDVVENVKLESLKTYLEGIISDRLHKDF